MLIKSLGFGPTIAYIVNTKNLNLWTIEIT